MKKTFLLLSIMFLSSQSFSQELRAYGSRSGSNPDRFVRRVMPQGQLLYSNYQSTDSANYVNKQGWGAGILTDLLGSENLVLETGLIYRELNGGTQNTFANTSYTYDYLSLPVSAKYYISGQELSSFYLKLGAMASTLTASTVNYSPGYAGSTHQIEGRSFETAGLAGAGYKFSLNPESAIFLEGDYSRPTDILFQDREGYNAAWNFSAGVAVNL